MLTTFGSLGDLHPYIAVALGLQARGHEAIIATTRRYRQKIEARGVGFHAVRPDGPDLNADHDAMRRIMDPRQGTEFVVRELLMPVLHESYEDVLAAARGADLLVSHTLTYATRLVAEKRHVFLGRAFSSSSWASSQLTICPFCCRLPFLSKLRLLDRPFTVPCSGWQSGVAVPGLNLGTVCGPRLTCRPHRKIHCLRVFILRR